MLLQHCLQFDDLRVEFAILLLGPFKEGLQSFDFSQHLFELCFVLGYLLHEAVPFLSKRVYLGLDVPPLAQQPLLLHVPAVDLYLC